MPAEILPPSPGRIKRQLTGREQLFASVCPPGLEDLCLAEAQALGLLKGSEKIDQGILEWSGKFDELYKALAFSRIASRILVRLDKFHAGAREELFRKVHAIPWELWLPASLSLRVDAHVEYSRISHEGMAAETTGQAIRRRLGDAGLSLQDGPEQRIIVRIVDNHVTISLDACGDHLHRRGWRKFSGNAPLRENLAAGLLRAADWPNSFDCLVDGMTGSGTFAIEALRSAAGLSSALGREFACGFWPGYSAEKMAWWQRQTLAPGPSRPRVIACEVDPAVIEQARANAQSAAVDSLIDWHAGDFFQLAPPKPARGLLVLNPPYGLRLSDGEGTLYPAIAARLRAAWRGWRVLLLGQAEQLPAGLSANLLWTRQFRHGGLQISAWFYQI